MSAARAGRPKLKTELEWALAHDGPPIAGGAAPMVTSESVVTTLGSSLSSAELCRRNGWGPGTKLVGTEYYVDGHSTNLITITAVGDAAILAYGSNSRCECVWDLTHRDWHVFEGYQP